MALLTQLLTLCALATLQTVVIQAIRTTCYFGSWAHYRPGEGKFEVEDINVKLCDVAIYSFIGLNEDATIKILDPNQDVTLRGFQRFTGLKKKNRNLKCLIAIGGWNEGSTKFSKVAANKGLRAKFIKNIIEFIKKYKFDGLDFDWEYPAKRGGTRNDKKNFADWCKETRQQFDKSKYTLTAAVSAEAADESYDIPTLSRCLHNIHLMTYDFHSSTEPRTGQNAPLYAGSADTTDHQKTLNVDYSARNWIKKGADRKKIILGLGMYGVSYSLQNPRNNGIGALAKGPGKKGQFTQQDGMLGYNEICKFFKQGGWVQRFDNKQQVPYAYKGDQWVGFDNPRSIKLKVGFAKKLGLGGCMVWSVETDDFRGSCGPKYPLLNVIKSG